MTGGLNLLLRGGRLVDPSTGKNEVCDIRISGGVLEKIADRIEPARGEEVLDLKGIVVAPGFLDMHVHFREPGQEHKETIATGCAAAAAGGFTAVCCMPNTQPPIDEASIVRDIRERARAAVEGVVDLFPIAAVTKKREGLELAPMLELAAAGAAGFSDDGAPVSDPEILRRAFEYASMAGLPVIQHAEETSMTKGGAMNEGAVSTALGLPPMPPIAEELMVRRDIRIAEYCGGRYHVAHISTAGAVDAVREAKKRGAQVTCEAAPHHFSLTDEAVRTYDTNTKMNPPLRTRADVDAVREGLRDGTIDAIATDHAPHSFDEKEVEFVHAPFGIVGLETAIGLAMTGLVGRNVLSLEEMIRKFSVNPRMILRLPPVEVREGERANLTLIDPETEWVVDVTAFRSKSSNSPFGGWKLKGKPFGVINNGSIFRP